MVDVYHPTVPNGPLDVPPSQLSQWLEAGWSQTPTPTQQEDNQPHDQ